MDEGLLEQAHSARDRFVAAQHNVDSARVEYHYAIRRLHASGGSMREIAHALGLSHQRVHQIIDEAGTARGEPTKRNLLKRLTTGVAPGSRAACERGPVSQAFDRMSGDARQAMVLTQQQARSLGHHYVGTEHILLGLLDVEHGVAAQVLARAGISQQAARAEVLQIIGRGKGEPPDGPLRFTPRSKKVLELAGKEAKHDRSAHVRSEHLLLGLLREGRGVGAQILTRLGADHNRLRRQLGQARRVCSFCRRSGIEAARLVAGPGVYICDRCTSEAALLATHPDAKPDHAQLTVVPPGRQGTACSFCGKRPTGPDQLITGPDASICNECLTLCREINAEDEPPSD
jgi:hypothetical protein